MTSSLLVIFEPGMIGAFSEDTDNDLRTGQSCYAYTRCLMKGHRRVTWRYAMLRPNSAGGS